MAVLGAITDRHLAGDSTVHRLDPRTKLLVTIAFVFAALLTPQAHWAVFGLLALFPLGATLAAGISPLVTVRRSLLALPFVLAAVPVLFNRPGEELFTVPLFGWSATMPGLEALSSILLRSWLSVLMATVMTATTEPDAIVRALRWFGVPRLLVSTISFMWRYVFVIAEEAQRLLRAREARSARVAGRSGGSLLWRAHVAGNMVGTLFLRSLDRSERVYVAMLARGYNGEPRALERLALGSRDLTITGVALTLLLMVVAYGRL